MPEANRKIYFCIDFEDWYHIPYLSKYGFSKNDYTSYADKISDFVDWLNENGIVANFFVVGDIAKENAEFLKKCKSNGHQIGCHSLSHLPINKMTNDEFIEDTLKAKHAIEEAVGDKVVGYRAPFFSLTDEKLALLKKLGFEYDSSYIQSNKNEYYEQMNLDGFSKVDSLAYDKNTFMEYEVPTLKNKPIAGGGFFRLYPFFLYKIFLKKHMKRESNFVFFIHPFEIAGNIPFLGLKKMSIKDRIRFQLGRKRVRKKIEKTIRFFKENNYSFSKMSKN